MEYFEDPFREHLESVLNRNLTTRSSGNIYNIVVRTFQFTCNSSTIRHMKASVLEKNLINPRLQAFSRAMDDGTYDDMAPKERAHRPNTIRTDVNAVIAFFTFLSEGKDDKSWESTTWRQMTQLRSEKWNKAISKQEKRAKNWQMRKDSNKNVRMEESDFVVYMQSEARKDAAAIFSKENPTPAKCVLFRNFVMTEVAVCNTNRPGVWGCVKVGDIRGKKTELVNGEHQLQTEDPKTHMTRRLTFPESIWLAINKYIDVHRASLMAECDRHDIVMVNKNGSEIDIKLLSKCTMMLINQALQEANINKKITSTKIRKSTAKRTKGSDPSQDERRQRMSIQQTHSAATHVLSYEGLDTREEAQFQAPK